MLKHDALNFLQDKVDETVKHYKTDLLRDIEILSRKNPKAILWAARECGTQIITQDTDESIAATFLEYWSSLQWYQLENIYEDDKETFTYAEIDFNGPIADILKEFYNK